MSQSDCIELSVSSIIENKTLFLSDSEFQTNDSNDLQIEVLKFYISNLKFLKNTTVVLEEKNSFHLVDASQINPMLISISNEKNIDFDEFQFSLGIDSITNVSGAMGGDLDPTKGMYWTWQSGYINFKLEGKSTVCETRNNEFQFHLGGYQLPNYCLQTLRFPVHSKSVLNLQLDVQCILEAIDLTKTTHVMSPTTEAVLLSKIVADSFVLTQN